MRSSCCPFTAREWAAGRAPPTARPPVASVTAPPLEPHLQPRGEPCSRPLRVLQPRVQQRGVPLEARDLLGLVANLRVPFVAGALKAA